MHARLALQVLVPPADVSCTTTAIAGMPGREDGISKETEGAWQHRRWGGPCVCVCVHACMRVRAWYVCARMCGGGLVWCMHRQKPVAPLDGDLGIGV